VQRTRSSPSALRSPLTRHPLGASLELGGVAPAKRLADSAFLGAELGMSLPCSEKLCASPPLRGFSRGFAAEVRSSGWERKARESWLG